MIESMLSIAVLFLAMILFLAMLMVGVDLRNSLRLRYDDWIARRVTDLENDLRAQPQTHLITHLHVHVTRATSHPQAPRSLIAKAQRQNAYVVLGHAGWEFRDHNTHKLIAIQTHNNHILEANNVA